MTPLLRSACIILRIVIRFPSGCSAADSWAAFQANRARVLQGYPLRQSAVYLNRGGEAGGEDRALCHGMALHGE